MPCRQGVAGLDSRAPGRWCWLGGVLRSGSRSWRLGVRGAPGSRLIKMRSNGEYLDLWSCGDRWRLHKNILAQSPVVDIALDDLCEGVRIQNMYYIELYLLESLASWWCPQRERLSYPWLMTILMLNNPFRFRLSMNVMEGSLLHHYPNNSFKFNT